MGVCWRSFHRVSSVSFFNIQSKLDSFFGDIWNIVSTKKYHNLNIKREQECQLSLESRGVLEFRTD